MKKKVWWLEKRTQMEETIRGNTINFNWFCPKFDKKETLIALNVSWKSCENTDLWKCRFFFLTKFVSTQCEVISWSKLFTSPIFHYLNQRSLRLGLVLATIFLLNIMVNINKGRWNMSLSMCCINNQDLIPS